MAAKQKAKKKAAKKGPSIEELNNHPAMLGGPPIGEHHRPGTGIQRVLIRKGVRDVEPEPEFTEKAPHRARRRKAAIEEPDDAGNVAVGDLEGISAAQARKLSAAGFNFVEDLDENPDINSVEALENLNLSKAAVRVLSEALDLE